MVPFDPLWQALRQPLRTPDVDLVAAVRARSDVGLLPPPWATRTLI